MKLENLSHLLLAAGRLSDLIRPALAGKCSQLAYAVVAAAVAVASAAPLHAAGIADSERGFYSQNDIVIVRVRFNDISVGKRIATSFEPIEAN